MSAARSGEPFVYFIRRADGEGPVKIGCSQRPEDRLSTIMQWAPYPLAVAARCPGDETLERRFHAHFAAQWSHREWFHPSPALDETIRRVAASTYDFTALPTGKRLPSPMRQGIVWTVAMKLGANLQRSRMTWGFEPPEDVRQALARLAANASEAPEADEALVRAHLERPWERGALMPYAWALEAAAKLGAKHGFTVAATVRREAA